MPHHHACPGCREGGPRTRPTDFRRLGLIDIERQLAGWFCVVVSGSTSSAMAMASETGGIDVRMDGSGGKRQRLFFSLFTLIHVKFQYLIYRHCQASSALLSSTTAFLILVPGPFKVLERSPRGRAVCTVHRAPGVTSPHAPCHASPPSPFTPLFPAPQSENPRRRMALPALCAACRGLESP